MGFDYSKQERGRKGEERMGAVGVEQYGRLVHFRKENNISRDHPLVIPVPHFG